MAVHAGSFLVRLTGRLLEEQERRLLQAYARYDKQRWKNKRDQIKERIEKQVRRLLAQKHP